MNYRKISPENIPGLQFAKTEVLQHESEKLERVHALKTAMVLSNNEHEEIGIVAQLANGEPVEINSSLIDLEDTLVEVRGGYAIPLHAILRVEL